jgi:hypothetical protein
VAAPSRSEQAKPHAPRGAFRQRRERALLAALALASGVAACRSGEVQETPPPTVVVTSGGAGARPRRVDTGERKPPFASPPWHIPVGPNLVVVPGKGLGPIRFGANIETIERLIGEPCEEKREEAGHTLCRYSAQAVDFVLEGGGITEMRAHRLGRLFRAEPKLEYGIFNGRFESGVAFGMLPAAVEELLGKPKATRAVEGENAHHTELVYDYDGVTLEFDRISAQSVVLGGLIMRAPPPPSAPTKP